MRKKIGHIDNKCYRYKQILYNELIFKIIVLKCELLLDPLAPEQKYKDDLKVMKSVETTFTYAFTINRGDTK